ncbi:MAG: ABC transporter ATP-binding protein [Dehalococcoidia bacterium]
MTGARVTIDHVSRRYDAGAEKVWALRDLSLDVAPGEFLAVIGRSGSGKTTLLNLIAGLDRPTSGTITVDGREIGASNDDELTRLRRHTIGFVFQSFGLLPLLTALENVELALRIAGARGADRGRRAREVMDLVGLTKRLHHRPYELSGGEQQRVAIARALANRPSLLLADEPTGELDSSTALTIFSLLREVVRSEGVTIVTSTHDRTVIDLAGRVEELADGVVVPPNRRTLLDYVVQREGDYLTRSRADAISALEGRDDRPRSHGDLLPGHEPERHAPEPLEAPLAQDAPAPGPGGSGSAEDDVTRWARPDRRS